MFLCADMVEEESEKYSYSCAYQQLCCDYTRWTGRGKLLTRGEGEGFRPQKIKFAQGEILLLGQAC